MGLRDDSEDWHAQGIEWQLLDRYLAGEASPDDRRDIEQWLARGPGRDAMLRALADPAWRGGAPRSRDTDARWQAWVAHHAAPPTVATPHVGVATPLRGVLRRRGGSGAGTAPMFARSVFAAAAILVLGAVGAVTLIRQRATAPAAPGAREYATSTGQQASIVLADGSRVTLAPQSRLRVSGDFGAANRTVSLVGEAYFDVASTVQAPFIVSAGGVDTRVLGTAFDVRHYPGDHAVRVAVVRGKVAVGGTHRPPRLAPLVLTPGTVGVVTDTTAVAATVGDTTEYTSWTRGQLRFRDAPVPAMLATVGRWYGYEFVLADSSLESRHVTAEFIVNAPDKTLVALKALLDVDMTFDGSRVTLRARRNSSTRSMPGQSKDRIPMLQPKEVGK